MTPGSWGLVFAGNKLFAATAYNYAGSALTTSFTWTTGNDQLVTVNPQGLATALSTVGTTYVQACVTATSVCGIANVSVAAPVGLPPIAEKEKSM